MATAAHNETTPQRLAGPLAIGAQGDRVLVHLDRSRDFLNVSGAEALQFAYQFLAAARAAGAVSPAQRTLF